MAFERRGKVTMVFFVGGGWWLVGGRWWWLVVVGGGDVLVFSRVLSFNVVLGGW